jgi:hypothetical protein
VVQIFDTRDRSQPVWSCARAEDHSAIGLSDNGEVVVTFLSGYIRREVGELDGVIFWNRSGAFRRYPLRDLCPDPPTLKEVQPDADVNLPNDLRIWCTRERTEGNLIIIRTIRDMEYTFRLSDGELIRRQKVTWFRWVLWIVMLVSIVSACLHYRRSS